MTFCPVLVSLQWSLPTDLSHQMSLSTQENNRTDMLLHLFCMFNVLGIEARTGHTNDGMYLSSCTGGDILLVVVLK